MGEFVRGVLDDFTRHWLVYSSIPVVAALIGYVTKLVAIRMLFQPLDLVGQGIVPKRGEIVTDIAAQYQPGLWESLPKRPRGRVRHGGHHGRRGVRVRPQGHGCHEHLQGAGRKEFQFIARSGLFIGWFPDWLALKMIFRRKRPVRYFGPFEWQGLFLKPGPEVPEAYASLIAKEIITPRNVIEAEELREAPRRDGPGATRR